MSLPNGTIKTLPNAAKLGSVCELGLYSRNELRISYQRIVGANCSTPATREAQNWLTCTRTSSDTEGILWVLRTGAPWRDLPERYGKWPTVYSRFQRCRQNDIWDQVFAGSRAVKDREGRVEWEVHFIDGSVVRAYQHAAGAKKSILKAEVLGRSRCGLSTKIHVRDIFRVAFLGRWMFAFTELS